MECRFGRVKHAKRAPGVVGERTLEVKGGAETETETETGTEAVAEKQSEEAHPLIAKFTSTVKIKS